jgi:Predicted transcriptional regulators
MLERRRYSAHPPRDEYLLTERGRDFRPVIWSLLAWGNKHLAPGGPQRPAGGQPDRRPGRSGPGGSGERPAADRPSFRSWPRPRRR